MTCTICNRNLTRCICADADSRIHSLVSTVDISTLNAILVERHLAKFEIERDRQAQLNNTSES